MYAFTDSLQEAWQAFFQLIKPALSQYWKTIDGELRFETDESTLAQENLAIGQTCGYPLVNKYQGILQPVCVPVFELRGCDGPLYSSVIIVAKQSNYISLKDCADKIVTINDPESNSGMNLLRATVQPLMQGTSFFSSTQISGEHIKSVRAVVEHQADIAAIDCVTYAMINDAFPALTKKVRIIAGTGKTMGLPFVIPVEISSRLESATITALFNDALTILPQHFCKTLHLAGFTQVSLRDYQSIVNMEDFAQQSGHSSLAL